MSLEGNSILILGLYRLVTGCRGCLLVCRGALEFIVQTIGSYRGIKALAHLYIYISINQPCFCAFFTPQIGQSSAIS